MATYAQALDLAQPDRDLPLQLRVLVQRLVARHLRREMTVRRLRKREV